MPDTNSIRAFLRQHYRHSRFEGRDGATWGADYSAHLVESTADDLARYGKTLISWHDSASGRTVWFDADLNLLGEDTAERAHNHGSLSHIL